MDVKELREGLRVLKLEPGDRVAISFDEELTEEIAEKVATQALETWGLKVLLLGPGVELSVIREGESAL